MPPSKRSLSDVVNSIGFGKAQCIALLAGGGIWIADGAELLLIGTVTRSLSEDWSLRSHERGLVVSCVFMGVLLGNAFSGSMGDIYGRRLPVVMSYLGIVVFSVLSALSWGLTSMVIFRILVGVSFGLGQPAWNALGTEIAPTAFRVTMNGMSQILFVFGEIYSAGLIWAEDPEVKDLHWRRLLILGAIPSLILGIGAYFFLIESPSYLANNAKSPEKARVVLKNLAGWNGHPNNFDVDFVVTAGMSQRSDLGYLDHLKIIWGRHLAYTTFTICYSTFVMNFIYYGALYAFPQVLPELGLHLSPAANLFLGAIMEIPGFLLGLFLGDKMTRKNAVLVYLIVSVLTVGIFLYGVGFNIDGSITEANVDWAVQGGFLGMKAAVNIGFLILYLYSSEVYPTSARTTGTATCLAAGRIGAMACPMVYEGLTDYTGYYHHFFVVIGALGLVNIVLVAFLSIETAGKSLEDEIEPLNIKTEP